MKKTQINDILEKQTKRRKHVLSLISIIIIVSMVTVSFFFMFINGNKKQYINYDEKSDIDYKVFLKKNDFFSNSYLGKGNKYIASLINYIKVNFNYKIALEEENVQYKYSYKIEANVTVKEKDSNDNLYTVNKLLLNSEDKITNSNNLTINEDLNIDYNYYNDLIKDFVNIYGLNNTNSILTINMYVNTVGTCENIKDSKEKETIISMSIPLTTKTVAIDISDNIVNSNSIMLCKKSNPANYIFLIFSILFLLIDAYLIVLLIKYEVKTRTAENIYEKELKRILNNYGSYIQNLGNDFNFKDYQVLKVNTFDDMLEIRDTIKQPILMKENNNKTGAYFIIPSVTKILYVYRLAVSDIKRNSEEKKH